MAEFNWVCPHCQAAQTVSRNKVSQNLQEIYVGDTAEGDCGIHFQAIGCSNPECKKITVKVTLGTSAKKDARGNVTAINKDIFTKQIYPSTTGKLQPDYIPRQIVQDYNEACNIRDLSPKASATLIRRCLKGIIRDFCKIKKNRLIDEIDALRVSVDNGTAEQGITLDSVDAIDHVRNIGNIGAHMEKDINIIVDVDPKEAQVLIELVEMLFDEWYVARHKREQRLTRLKEIAGDKNEAKKALPKPGNADKEK